MQPDGGYAPLTPEEEAAAQAARDEAAADAAQAAALQTTPPPAGPPPQPEYVPESSAYTADPPPPAAPPPSGPPPTGGLLSPDYVPREQGPGMYSPPYHAPGIYTELPPYRAPRPEYPTTEPGMYTGRWERPGEAVLPPPVNEPGMYEPHYIQPGYYTPRSASTYYGGDVWPTPYTGTERAGTIPGQTGPGPLRSGVQVLDPATGEQTVRLVPNLGNSEVVQEGPRVHTSAPLDPTTDSRGEMFGQMAGGGQAPPVPVPTLGMMPNQLAYLESQGDQRVTRNAEGRLVLRDDLPWNPPVGDRLKGLYGGGEQRSSRPTPLPPKHRRR